MTEKCNSCGAEIEYTAGSQSLKCPYCGATNEIQKAEDQLPDVVEKIIPLTVSQDELEKLVYGYMARGNYTPDDMLEGAAFTKQECFYVPAFLFDVEYEATWTASFGYDRTYTTGSGENRRTHTVTDWNPVNGVDAGVFPVSTYAGKTLRDSALSPSNIVPFTIAKGGITNFNPSFMKGVQAESFVVSEASAFSSLKDEINSNIDRKVQSHGQGDHQKDWHWNAKMSHSANTLYVPICHAVFDYQGTEYHVWMDGIDGGDIRADKLPEDKDRQKLVYLGFIPAGVAIASLIATSITWVFTWGGLVAATLLGGYAALRRKSIIEYSMEIRDSLLTQIHASSSAMKEMTSEERDKLAKAFQRPEKPFFAKTHQDRAILPVLSLAALLVTAIPSYFTSPGYLKESMLKENLKQTELTAKPAQDLPKAADKELPPWLRKNKAIEKPTIGSPEAELVAVSSPVMPESIAAPAVKPAVSASANTAPVSSQLTQQVSQPVNESVKLIESIRQDANTCMRQQDYECAEVNLKTILRLSPNDPESVAALQQIKQIRENAFKGDWNAK